MSLASLVLAALLGGTVTHDVAVVTPGPARQQGEWRTARESAHLVAAMLVELGLTVDLVDDTAAIHEGLGAHRVAVVPYHPDPSEALVTALGRFLDGGGKLITCYTLPPRLAHALGFALLSYQRPKRADLYAEIRFTADDIPLLPASVHQASWNILAARPAGYGARVVGRWYTATGNPSGQAAVLLSDRGAFFSHLILPDDREGKQQMLAALVGHLAPALWPHMAQAVIERAGAIGHCETAAAAAAYVKAQANPAATRLGEQCDVALATARTAWAGGDYPRAFQAARRGRTLLAEAYLRTEPSRQPEGRAMWNHSGTGAYPGDWPRTARALAEHGFNMILPNMLWAGSAHYASDVLPRSETFLRWGDQIQQCVEAAHANGLEVHVWKVNFNLGNAPRSFVVELRRQGRTQVSVRGEPVDWLCPSHPENQKLELDSMLEVAQKYAVDGLQFDYIRYPDHESCYCDGCRRRFEAQSGVPVAAWPQDCYAGSRKEEYNRWRCAQITHLVATVHAAVKKARPEIKLSAAVFGGYPQCRESVAQDWPAWIKAGYLDFVCPMDYTAKDAEFSRLVKRQVEQLGGRVPLYPGIGVTSGEWSLTADRVVGQIHLARAEGAQGFCLFNLDRNTIETIVPGVGLGATAERAKTPQASFGVR